VIVGRDFVDMTTTNIEHLQDRIEQVAREYASANTVVGTTR
jgi:hypothetical protein